MSGARWGGNGVSFLLYRVIGLVSEVYRYEGRSRILDLAIIHYEKGICEYCAGH